MRMSTTSMEVFAGPDVGVAFERRRGRAEQAHRAAKFRAHHGDVAAVVARRLILLVGRLVLLVHDDESKILHGRKNRRACPHDHPCLARREREPAVEPLTFAQVAVPHDRRMARGNGREAAAQARDRLRREGDLGHEENHAAARRKRLRDGAQVNLGLARAGHAVEQMRGKLLCGQARPDRGNGGALLGIERVRLRGDEFAAGKIIGIGHALDATRLLAHDAAFHQRRHHRRGEIEPAEHGGFFLRKGLRLDKMIKLCLLRRAFLEFGEFVRGQLLGEREEFIVLEARAVAHGGGQHRLDDFIERRGVVGGDPAGKLEQVGRQRRKRIHGLRERFQLIQRKVARRADLADNAEVMAVEQRHAHERAHADTRAQPLGHAVMQQFVETREGVHADDHPVGHGAVGAYRQELTGGAALPTFTA
jgi:hypothetical protein